MILLNVTWTQYWTVIGIVYPIYYGINIAYDLWVYNKKKKQLENKSNIESESVSEDSLKQALNRQIVAALNQEYELKHQHDVVDLEEKRGIDEVLKDINKDNMSALSKLQQF